jgi:hypothetical protein
MKKYVYVDTAALIALGSKTDNFHSLASQVNQRLIAEKYTFLTTNAVVLELANAFSRVRYKPLVISLIEAIQQSSKWHYLIIDETLMTQGLNLFKQRLDKDWSLVDCLGIHLARQFQITEIFTTDHHFEQAGFKILLKSSD